MVFVAYTCISIALVNGRIDKYSKKFYLIFYLMILGNTFMFGVIKEKSKGVLPCVIAHMLVDSFAVLMLVQSNLIQIIILVSIEIIFSWFADKKLVVE
mgnify:CR=1 FL=1